MILVRFTGGLGNQLFQYALGTCLASHNKTVLKIDTTLLEDRSQPHEVVTHRDLDLDHVFDIALEQASVGEITLFNGKSYNHIPGKLYNKFWWNLQGKKNLIVEQGRNFHSEILKLKDNKCLVGAWQSEKYFKEKKELIRELLVFRDSLGGAAKELGIKIQSGNSVCISTRRGDYVTSPVYSKTLGALPAEYFHRAIAELQSKQQIDHVYVFTDDPEWSRSNLKFSVDTTFVGEEYNGPRYATKFQLMTLCRHFIIPNSTFGWWAAWLGTHPDKTVVAPAKWFLDPAYDDSDLVPENWVRI